MRNGDIGIVRRERSGKRCCRVPLDHHHVGTLFLQNDFHSLQHASRDILEGLTTLHDVEIVVHTNVKNGDYLIKHFAMLRRNAYARDKAFALRTQCLDHRGKLDGFGSCAEYNQDFMTMQ